MTLPAPRGAIIVKIKSRVPSLVNFIQRGYENSGGKYHLLFILSLGRSTSILPVVARPFCWIRLSSWKGRKKRRKREEKGGDNGNLRQQMNLFEGAEFSFNTLTVHIRVIYSADLRTIFEGIWKDAPQECY